MIKTMFGLDRATHQIKIYLNPYWVNESCYMGTIPGSDTEYPVCKNDALFYKGSISDFMREIININTHIHKIELFDPDSTPVMMNVLNGFCSIFDSQIYSMFFFFDTKPKAMKNILVKLVETQGVYHVSSCYFEKDVKYLKESPMATKSYSDVLNTLSFLKEASSETIAEHLNTTSNRTSGRLSELERGGFVRKCGFTRSKYNKKVFLWTLCEKEE